MTQTSGRPPARDRLVQNSRGHSDQGLDCTSESPKCASLCALQARPHPTTLDVPSPDNNCFEVSRGAKAEEQLGLEQFVICLRRPSSVQPRLKKAYRQKSLRYHPDKNPSPDAKVKFQKITEAYSVLSDDKKRLKYDKSGDMDLEDFDMDQFMNMWVGEMMEDGGVVDDMMQSVLPWRDDEDKLQQFMDEHLGSVRLTELL